MGALNKWNDGKNALTPERRLMNEALARLEKVEVKETKAGRLMVALDLTASREPTLRQARLATAAMFDAIKALGAVAVKLVYYRGNECKAGPWCEDAGAVCRSMLSLSCKTGYTQIGRILRMAADEPGPVSAVVFIGDECEEDGDEVTAVACKLGRKHIPVFVFHEQNRRGLWGSHQAAEEIFEAIASASGGVYCPFGGESAAALRELLSTVAVFSAGGIEAVKKVPQVTTPEAKALQTCLLLGPAPSKGGKS